eukprot:4484236-Prymnesium_polylepis.1
MFCRAGARAGRMFCRAGADRAGRFRFRGGVWGAELARACDAGEEDLTRVSWRLCTCASSRHVAKRAPYFCPVE